MTWWQRFTGVSQEEEKDPERGENGEYDLFIDYLNKEGYYFNDEQERKWWQRVWTTHVPYYKYPDLKQIYETYQFVPEDNRWIYRIIRPDRLGGIGGGGNAHGWCVWEDLDAYYPKSMKHEKITAGKPKWMEELNQSNDT